MAVTLSQLLSLANNNLQDSTDNLSTSERNELVKKAVRLYSRRRPYLVIQVYTGNATGFYDKPTGWDNEFSAFIEVEYPVEQSPKVTISESDYDIELMGEGEQLRFYANRPGDDEAFWVKYTAAHILDSDENYASVSETDAEGISYLATSLMCSALASFYATKSNPNLSNIEIVGYGTRSQEYKTLASDWFKKYDGIIIERVTGKYSNVPFISNSFWDRTNE